MQAPVGTAYMHEISKPVVKQTTEITAVLTVTALKVLNSLIALSDGKIISAEISIAPIRRIPTTTVKAVSTAMKQFISFVLRPVARAKLSSKVTAKT